VEEIKKGGRGGRRMKEGRGGQRMTEKVRGWRAEVNG
jgi:hypothetical protein